MAKCAVGRWLWGARARVTAPGEKEPFVPEDMRADALVDGLADACERMGVRPLGPVGSMAAAQAFVGRMRRFGSVAYSSRGVSCLFEAAVDAQARREKEERRERELEAIESAAAHSLSRLMDKGAANVFLEAVANANREGFILDADRRAAERERVVLAMTPAAESAKRILRV